MTWKRLEECTLLGGEDGAEVSIGFDLPGDRPRTVEVCSADPEVAREAADLIQEALAARERRKLELAGEQMGYAIFYYGPAGFGSVVVGMRAPGLTKFEQLMQIQASIAKDLGGPATITGWQPIDPPSSIVRPSAGG